MKFSFILFIILLIECTAFAGKLPDKTPLEQYSFQKLPDSTEIDNFLDNLTENTHFLKKIMLGKTAGNRNFNALFISQDQNSIKSSKNKVTVLIVGSLHATEYSGAEALQQLALEFAQHKHDDILNDMNIILIVNANPDGRDLRTRSNQNQSNLNADFINQKQPETQMITRLLREYEPDALLDLHESSMKKPILTLKQGYIKDIEAQYQEGNNPDIAEQIRTYSKNVLLPELMQITEKNGLKSSIYGGEILSLELPVSSGGLKISNLRNYSGLAGCFSFLVENRLDLLNKPWPTLQNIQVRKNKQYISVMSFLSMLKKHKKEIMEISQSSKNRWRNKLQDQAMLTLYASWVLNPQNPFVPLRLIHVETEKTVTKMFANNSFMDKRNILPLPQAYAVTAKQKEIAELLDLHHIHYKIAQKNQKVTGMLLKVTMYQVTSPINPKFSDKLRIEGQDIPEIMQLKKGDLIINTHQPGGRLAALLLDPRSINSIYHNKIFRDLITQDKPVTSIFSIRYPDSTDFSWIWNAYKKAYT